MPFAGELAARLPDIFETGHVLHLFILTGGLPYPLLAIPAGLAVAILCPNVYQWLDRYEPAMYYEPRRTAEPQWLAWRPTMPVGIAVAAATVAAIAVSGQPLAYLYWQF